MEKEFIAPIPKSEIRNPKLRIPWEGIRETTVLILFCLILGAAAFGWGVIYENRRGEDIRKEVYKIGLKERDLNGRLTAIETMVKKK